VVGKTAIVGAVEREGRGKAKSAQSTDRETLSGSVLDSVEFGALVYTDDASAYRRYAQKLCMPKFRRRDCQINRVSSSRHFGSRLLRILCHWPLELKPFVLLRFRIPPFRLTVERLRDVFDHFTDVWEFEVQALGHGTIPLSQFSLL